MAQSDSSQADVLNLLQDLQLDQGDTPKSLHDLESSPRQHCRSKLDSASTRLVFTTELLEQILLELPMQDLLIRIQRVSKCFREVIRGSLRLRRALFLEPGSPNGRPRLNPLLTNPRFLRKARVDFYNWELPPKAVDFRFHIGLGNGIACHRWGGSHIDLSSAHIRGSSKVMLIFCRGDCDFLRTERNRLCGKRVQAAMECGSWQEMYVSQPPMDVVWKHLISTSTYGTEVKVIKRGQKAANLFWTLACCCQSCGADHGEAACEASKEHAVSP